jgi:hypothetical protein
MYKYSQVPYLYSFSSEDAINFHSPFCVPSLLGGGGGGAVKCVGKLSPELSNFIDVVRCVLQVRTQIYTTTFHYWKRNVHNIAKNSD